MTSAGPAHTVRPSGSVTRKPVNRSILNQPSNRIATVKPVFGPIIRLPRPALTTDNTGLLYGRRAAQKIEPTPASAAWSPPDSWGVAPEQLMAPGDMDSARKQQQQPNELGQLSGSTWATTTASLTTCTELDWKALEANTKSCECIQHNQVFPDVEGRNETGDIELGLRRPDGIDYVDWIAEQRAKEERIHQNRANSILWRYRKQFVAALAAAFFLIVVLLVLIGIIAS